MEKTPRRMAEGFDPCPSAFDPVSAASEPTPAAQHDKKRNTHCYLKRLDRDDDGSRGYQYQVFYLGELIATSHDPEFAACRVAPQIITGAPPSRNISPTLEHRPKAEAR